MTQNKQELQEYLVKSIRTQIKTAYTTHAACMKSWIRRCMGSTSRMGKKRLYWKLAFQFRKTMWNFIVTFSIELSDAMIGSNSICNSHQAK